MIEGNMLQIIVVALFLGLGITMVGKQAQLVFDFFNAFAEVMYKLTGVIMELAPYGVFALIAPVVASYGLGVVLPLFKVILAVYLGCILHWLIVYSPLVRGLGKMSPWQFFRDVSPAMIYAFSTCSSSGTLPISMESARKLGVPNQISSFVLPLGATVNMDGTALYQGVCALFIAQVYGIGLGFGQQLMIVLTATLASIGTAGVPGAGLIMLSMVLTSVGLPLEGIALIAGIDRILDMIRTTTNITGDLVGAVIIAESEAQRLTESPSLPG
jgi:Na+/H+-dicarboxylate symporter